MTLNFFDTETTGLPVKNKSDQFQPHTVQLASIVTDDEGRIMSEMNHIIKPNGWDIPQGSIDVHGITVDIANNYGFSRAAVLSMFTNTCRKSSKMIAHNAAFDLNMLSTDYRREGIKSPFIGKEVFCTAQSTADLVKIPPTPKMIQWGQGNKFKTPNLQELHTFLFGEGFEDAHDAMIDVRACMRCYFELKKRGI